MCIDASKYFHVYCDYCSGDVHYEVISSEVGVQYHSTLVIKKSGRSDFGQYGCKITNRLGSAEGKIVLERKGMPFVFVENIILKIINKNTFFQNLFLFSLSLLVFSLWLS